MTVAIDLANLPILFTKKQCKKELNSSFGTVLTYNGILLLKLFWPTVRKKNSSD